MVRRSLKSCLKIARILLLEREMFRFFMPEMDLFKISSASNPAAEDSEEEDGENELRDGPEFAFEQDSESKQSTFNKIRDNSLATKPSDVNSSIFDDFESPYLFKKHMQREKIVFEVHSLVYKSNEKPVD